MNIFNKNPPRSTAYKPNPFTIAQLAQFQPQQGLLSAQNPVYQQYLAKMAGYGAGAGKTSPTMYSNGQNVSAPVTANARGLNLPPSPVGKGRRGSNV